MTKQINWKGMLEFYKSAVGFVYDNYVSGKYDEQQMLKEITSLIEYMGFNTKCQMSMAKEGL